MLKEYATLDDQHIMYSSIKIPLFDLNNKILGVLGMSQKIHINYISNLSKRQKECLYYLTRGMTIKQIAKVLLLSPRTVEFYFDNLRTKLNCHSRSELVSKAIEFGFIKNEHAL